MVGRGVFEPLALANGSVLPNRLAKASMEENLAGPGQLPDRRLCRLYRGWAQGEAGLLITGNVMIDERAMTGPAGVVLDARSPIEPFRAWAAAALSGTNQVWMQLNHPGRQVRRDLGGTAWAPSAVPIDTHPQMYGDPHAVSDAEITEVIDRFAISARRAAEAGFTGVQIHAAHGYLLSQFLSPLVNRRDDRWGGPLENRARLLLEVIAAVRDAMPSSAALGIKLNTADFQRGGFDEGDALRVVEMLAGGSVDLVELSGGSAEVPAMHGAGLDERTASREGYFVDLAARIVDAAAMPVMLTGGIRTLGGAELVLQRGVAVVGVATALAQDPDLLASWRSRGTGPDALPRVSGVDKSVAAQSKQASVRFLMRTDASGRPRPHGFDPLHALRLDARRRARLLRRYRAWRASIGARGAEIS